MCHQIMRAKHYKFPLNGKRQRPVAVRIDWETVIESIRASGDRQNLRIQRIPLRVR